MPPLAAVPDEKPVTTLRVVVFAGGRGAATLIAALAAHPQISLTVLVNAYDDGLSTGELRRVFPTMLGPSDIRKNAAVLARRDDRADRALMRLLDHRLPVGEKSEAGRAWVERLAGAIGTPAAAESDDLAALSVEAAEELRQALTTVLAKAEQHASRPVQGLAFNDMSVGNLVFAGQFHLEREDFNATVQRYCRLVQTRARVLNVTAGEPHVLVGLKESGEVLRRESAIVAPQDDSPIRDVFLLSEYPDDNDLRRWSTSSLDIVSAELLSRSQPAAINPVVGQALQDAHLIVFGPGTQHSSLFPSYLTQGICEAITGNREARKVFIANLSFDHDIPNLSVGGVLQRFRWFLSRKGDVPLPRWAEVMDRVIAQRPDDELSGQQSAARWLSLDMPDADLDALLLTVSDWTDDDGKHAGGQVVEHLLRVVQGLVDAELVPVRHRVSVVVPALDEARTIKRTLDELRSLDLSAQGVGIEIIVVDGGSTDGTDDIASQQDGVRVFRLPEAKGRGAALRCGVEKARGDIVVFFPADGEYNVDDIPSLVFPILENRFQAVFGSRAMKSVDLDLQSLEIYGQDRFMAAMSRYGGMSISIAALLLYNRYITDPLSSVKAFDTKLLRSLELGCDGVDLDAELLVRLAERRAYILEIPVSYRPRRRDQGKKIRAVDGLSALSLLLRRRLGRRRR